MPVGESRLEKRATGPKAVRQIDALWKGLSCSSGLAMQIRMLSQFGLVWRRTTTLKKKLGKKTHPVAENLGYNLWALPAWRASYL